MDWDVLCMITIRQSRIGPDGRSTEVACFCGDCHKAYRELLTIKASGSLKDGHLGQRLETRHINGIALELTERMLCTEYYVVLCSSSLVLSLPAVEYRDGVTWAPPTTNGEAAGPARTALHYRQGRHEVVLKELVSGKMCIP